MYQDNKYHFNPNKSISGTNPTSPPLHQIKNNTLETPTAGEARHKYTGGGIKLISNATTTAKGKEGHKYFEENPLFNGTVSHKNNTTTSGTSKIASFGNRIERGYETLREKKIIEKFPGE